MKTEFTKNRSNILEMMEPGSILLLDSGRAPHQTNDEFYFYTPHKSFYYLTGIEEENCKILLVKGTTESKTYLFIDETTEHMRIWMGEKLSKTEASDLSGISEVGILYNKQFMSFMDRLMSYTRGSIIEPPKQVYLDLLRIRPTEEPIAYFQFEELLKLYKELHVGNANKFLAYHRMFKTTLELNNIKKAIAITHKGLERVMSSLKYRDNERQVEADFDHEITLNGSQQNAFKTICASGINATVLHYSDNNSPLNRNDLLLCDLGAVYKNYASDISRTYPISGKFNKRQKEIYSIVLKANKESIEFIKPGITWKEYNDYAKNILATECKRIGLIKEDAEISKYYFHSIGHFMGLDTHDIGQYNLPLKEGMVVTVEPGLYIKEEGIGVRIEDDILLTKDGCINLSKDIIKEVEDIETFISKK